MEKNEEKSSSGCGFLSFCLLTEIFWGIYSWDKWTKLDYCPYLIIANIVIWAIIVWYCCFRK
jgi:hypothetical protein